MSDAMPLLLNMGADVANATGQGPVSGQTAATGSNGNAFAGILQSVLKPDSDPSGQDSLLAEEMQLNPLIFTQLAAAGNPLLTQEEISLDDLPIGNNLPTDEQELAWQSLLAEYDNQDPTTPRVVLAAGDELGFEVQALSAHDLMPTNVQGNTVLPGDNKLSPSDISDTDPASTPGVSLASLLSDKKSTAEQNLATDLKASLAVGQEPSSVAKSHISGAEEEALLRVMKAQQANVSRPASITDADTSSVNNQTQIESNQLFRDKIEQLAAHGGQENADVVNNKLDSVLTSSADQASMANRPASPSGASTYAAISGLGASLSASTANTPTIANMTIPPQNPSWGEIIGDRVQWMAGQNVQEARIRMHPQELGYLEVRIHVGADQQTTISFSSPHSQVRDALETAIPRLREMFGDNGLTLGDVNVSQHSSSQQGQAEDDNKSDSPVPSHQPLSGLNPVDGSVPPHTLIQNDGMLDLYA